MKVLFANRSKVDDDRRSTLEAEEVSLAELLQAADFVSVHVPGKSAQVIGADELALMQPRSCLINTARGSLVDEDALYIALLQGRIAGAALDVHTHEPRGAGDRFLALPNVLLTPHIAGGSRLGVLDEAAAIFENLGDALSGAHPRHARIA
jgi:phosphoglycerate dehydrogenase-like enzyme